MRNNRNGVTPPQLTRILFSTLAAALAAMVVAAPVAAQTTTGTITRTLVPPRFIMDTAVTLNNNREWEIIYSVDLGSAKNRGTIIGSALYGCSFEPTNPDCEIKSPYIMRYGAIDDYSNCSVGSTGVSQPDVRGINGALVLNSWQQTLRARPSQDYCIALFSSKPGGFYNTYAFAAVGFRTPADPNPPASPWNPNSLGQGCGAETSLALVRQCYRCKYQGTAETWNFNTNRCVSAGN